MTVRSMLKCDVCGTVTMLRTQLGWLDQHPIRIPCGKCKTLILGMVFLNQEKGTCEFKFENAANTEEIIPEYYIEVGGEILTDKLQKYNKDKIPMLPPPFFYTFNAMELENYQMFKNRVIDFTNFIKNDWPNIRRINDLWLNRKYEYIAKEVWKYFSKDKYPMDNKLQIYMAVHHFNMMCFEDIIDEKRFKNTSKLLLQGTAELFKRDIGKMMSLVLYFEDKGLLHKYEDKLFGQFEQFLKLFPFLIPAFGLKFYKNKNHDLYKTKGIITTCFEDLKQFYQDSYEVAGEIIKIVIAFNNLKYRGSFQKMMVKRKDVINLTDLDEKSKGVRLEFVTGEEDYDNLVYPYLDNQLRNAIGHNSYEYDVISQIVTYYPSGVVSEGKEEKIYLTEFADICWNIFLSLIDLSELIYTVRKCSYLAKGYEPIDPKLWD